MVLRSSELLYRHLKGDFDPSYSIETPEEHELVFAAYTQCFYDDVIDAIVR